MARSVIGSVGLVCTSMPWRSFPIPNAAASPRTRPANRGRAVKRVGERESPLVPMGLLHLLDTAEIPSRGGPSGFDGEAAAEVLLGEKHEVGFDLFLEISLALASQERFENAREEDAEPGHDSSSKIRLTIATVRPQLCASSSSCFRPERVIE